MLKAAATLITVAVGLAGIGVAAHSARRTESATEIGLITQLDAAANDSERDINSSRIVDKYRRSDYVELTRDEKGALLAALRHFEYFACLFDTGQLKNITKTRQYWAPRMVEAYMVASDWYTDKWLASAFPNLTVFKRQTPKGEPLPSLCL